jgi:hypothetical protein
MAQKPGRREVLRRAAYLAPLVLTLPVAPSFASAGSVSSGGQDAGGGADGGGGSAGGGRRRRRRGQRFRPLGSRD